MAKFKPYDYRQTKMLPISFDRQVLPGTFEYTLNEVIDEHVDLSVFEARYNNDEGGAPAYDPAILLKVILFAYSKGITSSRQIEALCRENIVCMALAADSAPHFTTIAEFVSSAGEQITRIFRDVLLVCDEAGLIGREMFAVDGVKLPANASREWSGTQAEYSRKIVKMERAVKHLLAQHRYSDRQAEPAQWRAREKQIETLNRAIEKVRGFLHRHQERIGASGRVKKSNITDNDSAKMPTSKGVVQGYAGVAMVDGKHQIVIEAQAHGEGQEHGLLIPMLEGVRANLVGERWPSRAIVLADAGYCSEANAKYLADHRIEGYIADAQFRRRDPRFADAGRHKPTRECEPHAKPKKEGRFRPRDFQLAMDRSHCICPAGKRLYRNGRAKNLRGFEALKYTAPRSACTGCPLRAQCLRHPERTAVRQVAFLIGRASGAEESYCARMKRRIDSRAGRYAYSRRLGIVEPVFGNIRHTHRLNRFTLRGRRKVDGQWKLFCLVHNIGKLHTTRALT